MFKFKLPILTRTKTNTMSNPTIKVNGVSIELTKEQLDDIARQQKLIDRKNIPAIQRIKTYEDACEELGKDPFNTLPFPDPKNSDHHWHNAAHKLLTIAEALREGKVFDWNNSNEYKWYPWFYLNEPGFRFDDSLCGWAVAGAGGARHCVDTREKSDYFGTQFLDLWKIYNGQ